MGGGARVGRKREAASSLLELYNEAKYERVELPNHNSGRDCTEGGGREGKGARSKLDLTA